MKYLDLWFIKRLPWLVIEFGGSKIYFIAISFYLFIAILCAKMSRVNKALVLKICISKLASFLGVFKLFMFTLASYGKMENNLLCSHFFNLVNKEDC